MARTKEKRSPSKVLYHFVSTLPFTLGTIPLASGILEKLYGKGVGQKFLERRFAA